MAAPTNLDYITAALRDLNIIAETQTASAEQGSHALQVMNDMLEEWTECDIDLGYFAQISTTDICPVPRWAKSGVQSQLAIRLAPTYGATVTAELGKKATDGYQVISRKAINAKLRPLDMSHLPVSDGQYTNASILTDGDSFPDF